MTQQQHPITPPPELVEQWIESTRSDDCIGAFPADLEQQICVRAAQYGADQELEACCYYFTRDLRESLADELRAHRRPKPPSLKEQALAQLDLMTQRAYACNFAGFQADAIRRALEALPDD
jgi:hypothetical protein